MLPARAAESLDRPVQLRVGAAGPCCWSLLLRAADPLNPVPAVLTGGCRSSSTAPARSTLARSMPTGIGRRSSQSRGSRGRSRRRRCCHAPTTTAMPRLPLPCPDYHHCHAPTSTTAMCPDYLTHLLACLLTYLHRCCRAPTTTRRRHRVTSKSSSKTYETSMSIYEHLRMRINENLRMRMFDGTGRESSSRIYERPSESHIGLATI